MKVRWLIGLLVATYLVSGCGQDTASNGESEDATSASSSDVNPSDPTGATQAPNTPQTSSSPLFQNSPIVSSGISSPLPVPNLIPPTTTPERLPQVQTGRPDPFATLTVPATVSINPRPVPAPPAATVSPAVPPAVTTVPAPSLPSLPPAQSVPVAVNQLPSLALPPLAPPQRMSETIEISGVVEVGGKTSVIVQLPNEPSRYVHVGDYLANGRVLVKRVEMGIEPMVILEEDGTETTRYIGSGSPIAGLL